MNTSVLVLIGYVLFTMALVLTVVTYRIIRIAGGKPADSWARGKPATDPDIIQRMSHAHINCLENLPLYAGLVIAAGLTNRLPVIDGLAAMFFAARILQSAIHVIQVSHWMVLIRGTFWTIQMVLLIYWAVALIGAA